VTWGNQKWKGANPALIDKAMLIIALKKIEFIWLKLLISNIE
jgi:hypothetical protein